MAERNFIRSLHQEPKRCHSKYHGNETPHQAIRPYEVIIKGRWFVHNPIISHGNLTDCWQIIEGQCWLITNQIRPCFLVGGGLALGGGGRVPLDSHDMIWYDMIYIYIYLGKIVYSKSQGVSSNCLGAGSNLVTLIQIKKMQVARAATCRSKKFYLS